MVELGAGKLRGLRRIADAHGRFSMLAIDQRPPIAKPVAAKMPPETQLWDEVARFKRTLAVRLQGEASALLIDPDYGLPAVADVLDPKPGLLVTLEDHGFVEQRDGRCSRAIAGWTPQTIRRCGGDAVKFLLWYRPDAGVAVRSHQQDLVRRIGDACASADIPFVLELLVYPLGNEADAGSGYVEMTGKRSELVLESASTFAEGFGVDLFKLESPVPIAQCDGSLAVQAHFDALGAAVKAPWVMLSAGADLEAFGQALTHAYAAGCSGYLAGRAIWKGALACYPDWSAVEAELSGPSVAAMRYLNDLTSRAAQPWFGHPAVRPVSVRGHGEAFVSLYRDELAQRAGA